MKIASNLHFAVSRSAKSFFLTPVIFLSALLILSGCNPETGGKKPTESRYDTPLDNYVNADDPAFRHEVMYQSKGENYRYFVLKMISQRWLTEDLVDEPEWWHWLSIVVPDSVSSHAGLIWIGGGASDDELPQEPSPILLQSALISHTIAADIHNIPNQPLTFKDDSIKDRYEDEIIAYGWRKFLEGGARDEDAIWLARLPMTKAVVNGMNTVSEFLLIEEQLKIEEFVVSGASKRGWTTWTTAAVDDRVIAIVPIVIDLLNIVPSFEHHWRNYGFWAPAINDYVNEGIMDWMRSGEFDHLLELTEPYSFIERYTMPKLLINASGDQFFQPDSWQFYWDDLKGEKHIRYVPNTGHSLRNTDALETLAAFHNAIVNNTDLPDYRWEIKESVIHVVTDTQNGPSEIKLWHAENAETRDFRVDVIEDTWVSSNIELNHEGIYDIQLPIPEHGWSAFFVELTYPGKVPLKVSTGITVLPHRYPFKPFETNTPKGTQ